MKLAFVSPRYPPYIGGVETHVKELAERLSLRGYEITVLTTDPERRFCEEEKVGGVKVKRFKAWAPGEAYYFSGKLKDYLSKNSDSFDVVHAHCYHAFPALYSAQTKSSNKLVFTPHYHGTGHTFFRSLLHIPYKYIAKQIFEKANRIICVSNYEKNLVNSRFKIGKEIDVIPNGINREEFDGLRKKPGESKNLLCVGRIERYKGIQYVIRALAELESNTLLDIIGEGPFKDNLKNLAKELNVTDRIRFFPHLPRKTLLEKYSEAAAFLLLSKHEAFGITVAEALSAKTPCILANTSALSEWIDNRNCFGVDLPINVDVLVKLIETVSSREVGLVDLWTWDDVASKTSRVYDEVMSN